MCCLWENAKGPGSWGVTPTPSSLNPSPPLLHLFGKGKGARGPGSWLSRTVGGFGVGIPPKGGFRGPDCFDKGLPNYAWLQQLVPPNVWENNNKRGRERGIRREAFSHRDIVFSYSLIPPPTCRTPPPTLLPRSRLRVFFRVDFESFLS